ncbi:MAG TPA: GNAT family N-acetyltransferase [Arenimonas sp.]|uniref:GNAT family N-acetyltransferase n=1 Tax=Arenimonas sp. TaxID=1872635 RepID=UPI002B6CEBF6|nr:GNAT family N-acetyltransferase [Arenimonas sp.]HMB57092.1 GNAT family N-acetyltransferase [Arenimonas sp.]
MSSARRQRPRKSASPDPFRIENLHLADSRHLQIRPIAELDAVPIAAAFHLLNEDEVRKRFLHPIKALGEEHLFKLTHPDPALAFAVVAAEPLPPGDGLVCAVARLSRDDEDPTRAEFGILVTHFVVGLGLGRKLMERLVEWSASHGIRELWGDVMDDNAPMLRLAQSLGFQRDAIRGAPGLIRITRHFL